MLRRLAQLSAVAVSLALALAAPAAAENSVVWAVGDSDASSGSAATAARITGQVNRFLYLGDVYDTGTASEFASFDTVWGKFKPIASPTPGNHEWANRATGYDPYWGARAPQTGGGHWFSVTENGWEIISLNSEESMSVGSPQHTYLKNKLATGGNCRIVMFHKPRYSAGSHGDFTAAQPVWDLMAGKVRLVLNGHDHIMQRAKPVNGITELVSGASRNVTDANNGDTRFAYINDSERGVLRLELTPVGSNADGGATASHRFVATDDGATLDSGSLTCTPAGTAPTPATTTTTLSPVADARVFEGSSGTNYATGDLRADAGTGARVHSYLKFSPSTLAGTVKSATLRLYAYSGTANGPAVYKTGTSWTESAITWNTKPSTLTAARDDKGAITANRWVEFDVTPFVTGNGTVSFGLQTTSTDGIDFYSREDSLKPQLVVTTG